MTNLDSDSRVYYGLPGGKTTTDSGSANMTGQHEVQLTGLAAGTVYQYRVESQDPDGRVARSGILYFRTLAAVALTKPTVALEMAATLSGKKASINALVGDATDVDHVIFTVDGNTVFTDYATPFRWDADTTAFNDGSHVFGAMAQDAAGNTAEATQDRDIRNLLSDALTPIHVSFTNPRESDTVTGIFGLSAELSNDLGLDISQIEFWIDETQVSQQIFSPAVDITPILAPVYIISATWNANLLSAGEHVAQVRVQDTAGNWGSDSQRFSSARRSLTNLTVTRDVVRQGNYFEITLNVTNDSTSACSNLVIEDHCQSLQCLPDARSRRGTDIEFTPLVTEAAVESAYDSPFKTQITASLYILQAGETKSLRYDAVPILRDPYDPWFQMSIGSQLLITYEKDGFTERESHDITYPISAIESLAATQSADYLIMTCHANIRADNSRAESDSLLIKMAKLARTRHAVLANVSVFRARWGAASVQQLIGVGGVWTTQMSPDWIRQGYLLIVGEAEIVPAWRVENVDLCDYPYANPIRGEAPELRVGRIIGNSADELVVPIESSLASAYDASSALMVSGPEETWEPFVQTVNTGSQALERLGIGTEAVHSEFWTYPYEMFKKALMNKSAAQARDDLAYLTTFLLKRIGPPRGADETADLMTYTPVELVSWLLWARNYLSAAATRDDAIDNSGIIISRWAGNPSLGEIVWMVLKGMMDEKETNRLLTENELAAWLLWEETAPRGRLSQSDLGSVTIGSVPEAVASLSLLRTISNADRIVDASRMNLAKERAEAIMTAREARGGSNGEWDYVYCADRLSTEQARSTAIKAVTAEGKDIICFNGHGDPGGWCGALTDWDGSGSEIEPISLGGRNPVVMAFSCYTGFYDEGPQYISPGIYRNANPSISEGFLHNGAAVYMGATEMMWSVLANDLLADRFWRYFPGRGNVGDCLYALKYDSVFLGSGWFHFKYYYNLYGDPKYGQR